MAVSIATINSLKSLPCFNEIQTISLLTNGLSQTAIKVSTSSQVYFAKKLNNETAITEVTCALLCDQYAARDSSGRYTNQQLSPQVIYHDHQWLVTEYINGTTLADSQYKPGARIANALSLMSRLHQLPISSSHLTIPTLNASLTVKRLLTNLTPLLTTQGNIIEKVSKYLTLEVERLNKASDESNVLCHGDINFTNILLQSQQKSWLIDFECAHFASIEFDIAMFIAVNNIPTAQLSIIVASYIELNQHFRCNKELLHYYLLYSFFINGLWYLNNKDKDEQSEGLFQKCAIAQWSAFDNFASKHAKQMPKLLPLLA